MRGLLLLLLLSTAAALQPTPQILTATNHRLRRISPISLAATPPPPAAAPETTTMAAAMAQAAVNAAAAEGPQLSLPELPKSKIRRGDYIVHNDYGIGLFQGVHKTGERRVNQETGERTEIKALRIKFRDGELDVPPARAKNALKLYKRHEDVEANSETVKLDGMRSTRSWKKRKVRAAKKVWAVAADLVKMYAERQELRRPPCGPDGERMAKFEAAFPFTPTPDQTTVFGEVAADMIDNTQPMDRLVCGDVGFGKTEVAMRAIYRAVCAGRQVALLAPTTVLAAQHYRVLLQRMPDVRVELISSLVKRKPAETAAIREDVASGKVEVLVGTHALLSPKIQFQNLGLLVVDEEQRFGVRQKEKVKAASTSTDVLSLSATPIPRTMYMCLAGIRAMSTLATPPEGRLPVITEVQERDEKVVLAAIKEELARGGQVFYVVPRVEMVDFEVQFLRDELNSDVVVDFAYSGIARLEQRVVDFTLGKTDVLVATTILENGIDIPNVNTIVVQATQLLGLSQLHQLRGRVGRARIQAYAYLMHPPRYELSDDALQRLRVLQRETALGAGVGIAKSDLSMRGAGNLFGEAQKGTSGMADIGVDMYVEVLQKAMRYLEEKRRLGLPDDEELEEQLLQSAVDDIMLVDMENTLAQ